MLDTKTINELIGIDESFKASFKLKEVLLNEDSKNNLFKRFLAVEDDLTFDWFTDYFQEEHSDRKGKKQDFTPNSVAIIASEILGVSESNADFCAGTGGLTIKRYLDNPDSFFYCEEFSDRALPFLLFNLAIRNLNAVVFHGDSLSRNQKNIFKLTKTDEFSKIEIADNFEQRKLKTVISNPPYSLPWSPQKEMLEQDRFKGFDVLAPKSKADYAFVLQGLNQLSENGTMTVILPHGVLFRGSAEGRIRKKIIEMNLLDAVIGLPEKLFLATDIPTVILVLKKNRRNKDILFIDASKDFEKGKNHNIMQDIHIQKVLEAYNTRKDQDKYSHLVSLEEIKENDFNLNIPRYVDTFEPEILPPISEITKELESVDKEIQKTAESFGKMLNELQGRTSESNAELKALVEYWNKKYNIKVEHGEEQMSLL
ncbi:MAG: N-6 DNA methylase [Liquorilactobacillus hordei]|uniref:N-6 DNA methylase n=1 Tax=Liquorilactobacillus hordei TaxID=468911 RepID=UPI0039EA4B4B